MIDSNSQSIPDAAPENGSGTPETKIAELEKATSQLKEQLLRKAAEFDNYKKRTENDTLMTIQFANERLIESLLPVVDDFERSMKMGKGTKDFDTLYSGLELIFQKFMKVLQAQGLKPYDVVGKPFHTDHHDALMQMPKEGVPPHTVIEEVEKGYMLNDKVLRHAKVIVSTDDGGTGTAQEDTSLSTGKA